MLGATTDMNSKQWFQRQHSQIFTHNVEDGKECLCNSVTVWGCGTARTNSQVYECECRPRRSHTRERLILCGHYYTMDLLAYTRP